jgi:transmembrane sensor
MSQINEFLEDPEFIRWVRFPEKKLNRYWQSWMEANPDKIEEIKLSRELVQGLQFPEKKPAPELKQEILNRILARSENVINAKKPIPGTVSIWERFSQFQRVAAIIIFTLALSVLYSWLRVDDPQTPAYVAVNMLTKSAAYGEKLNFRLPDGTTVWLNSGTRIEYPESFDSTVRMVRLYGEAFFDVKPDVNQPFQVVSENLITTALGTSFNINSNDREVLQIALVTGEVSIENSLTEEKLLLVPGQKLEYRREAKSGSIGSFSEGEVLAWKNGTLVFQNASFAKVTHELERWYGVEIKVAGKPTEDWNFSGRFSNQNLDVVLTSMSYIEDFRFELNDKKLRIKF